ncbi:hypothetical protein [Streptomyces nitrosporeus]|uniref:hypothetical protein n=1 Tax=Streptomyces nitrosporeus TaxID=28894 RepID=UPI0039A10B78
MTAYARGFRLHPRHGHPLDGAELSSGRVVVLDDPEAGLITAATSLEDLLRGGYHGARIEWAPAEHCGHQPPRFSEHTERTECVLRPGHQGSHADQRGMRWWLAETPGR